MKFEEQEHLEHTIQQLNFQNSYSLKKYRRNLKETLTIYY